MGYKALYRVYRPRTFDEVAGQEHITDVLKMQIKKNLISHAYIFAGPRGTGKTSTARIFANAVNCLDPQNGNPCLKCDICLSAAADNMIDIVEMDAASNNGVDDIRDLREKVSMLPVIGRYRVYILDEAHMLSPGAVNALLKTLEEPPPHVVFILATTELRKIPRTILSRCQLFDFKRISVPEIEKRLMEVAEKAKVSYEKEAIAMLARAGEGAMRDALSMMDMCMAGGKKLTAAIVARTLGTADTEGMKTLGDAVLKNDAKETLLVLSAMLAEGGEPGNILRDTITELSGRLSAAGEEIAREILRALEVLIYSQSTLKYSNTPDIVLETALLRAALPETATDFKDLGVRLSSIERRLDALEEAPVPAKERPAPKKEDRQQTAKDEQAHRKAEVLKEAVKDEPADDESDDLEQQMIKMFGKDKVVIKD
jgi:DNA polymerase-3 subunit gamma/tau